MVAAISEPVSTDPPNPNKNDTTRPPLLPSTYLSPSPSSSTSTSTSTKTSSLRRCPSPLLSRSNNLTPASNSVPIGTGLGPKRSQSVDRSRSLTPRPMSPVIESRQRNAGEVSVATNMLITSTRSLSVSFQGESFSLPISKTKTPSVSNVRRVTPERRKPSPVRGVGDGGGDRLENSKIVDQHRWPARIRQLNLGSNVLSKSLDCNGGIGSGVVGRALNQSAIIDADRWGSFDGRLGLGLGNTELLKAIQQNPDACSAKDSSVACDLTASDTDSVSSGSTSGVQECGVANGRSGQRGISVSARFWQETNSRLRRLQDPSSPTSTSPVSRVATPSKFAQSRKYTSDGPSLSPRTAASPVRGAAWPASPSKLWASSPSRGNPSPSRVRDSINGLSTSNYSNMPSVLSFSVDIRRGKVGENRVIDAHILRLLYNCYLQWRFVNARADATFRVQRLDAEKSLWNAWVTISDLRHSVTLKRIKLLQLRKKLKLTSILKGQMPYLEEWALLDRDHSNSLLGATEALKASTLRLPVVGKANADIQNLKDAVSSAVDVMHAMASSICSLSSMVEDMNSLVTELANVTAKERMLLAQCTEFLSTLAAMQVKDCSLRTHILQHRPITRA